MRLNIFISGQGYFARRVLAMCLKEGVSVVGVSCPIGDKYIGHLAVINEIPIVPSGSLNAETLPKNVDLGITAHSFDYIGKRTRYSARLGWIGFHPSLLPLHRGRSSIEWAIRMRDTVTGGTVYWLNSGIDRGDVAYQDWCFIDPRYFAMSPAEAASDLWRSELQDIGVRLLNAAVLDISRGIIRRTPQDPRLGSWEPSTKVNDIYRPDALMLPPPSSASGQDKTGK